MSTRSGAAISFAAVPLWLALVLAMPFVAIILSHTLPRSVANSAFFAPQYLFSLKQFVRPVDGGFAPLFSDPIADMACGLLWLATAVAFGYFARRLPWWTSLALAPLAVMLVAGALHLTAGVFGYALQLDGP